MCENVFVKPGAVLTIGSGVVVSFCNGFSLIVERLGSLHLRGNLKGVGAAGVWNGVEVWGDKMLPQSAQFGAPNQGYVELYDNSEISNALTGIKVYDSSNPMFTGGGIVVARKCTFTDNIIAVDFGAYNSALLNRSRFTFTKFNYTGTSYPHTSPFVGFVSLMRVTKVSFLGCEFTSANLTGYGILAINSPFIVDQICGGTQTSPCNGAYIPSKFYGLEYGVSALSQGDTKPFEVYNSEFENCRIGVNCNGVANSSIIFNKFDIGSVNTVTSGQTTQTGVEYNTNIIAMNIQENLFAPLSVHKTQSNAQGIACTFIGGSNNLIRRNTFTSLWASVHASKQNRSNSGDAGLHFECNNSNNNTDWDYLIKREGVRTIQGLVEANGIIKPAGNTFSNPNNLTWNIQNEGPGAFTIQYYHSSLANHEPTKVFDVNKILKTDQNLCLQTAGVPLPELSTEAGVNAAKLNYFENRNLLDNLTSSTTLATRSYYEEVVQEGARKIVEFIQYDTISPNDDSLKTWIGRINTYESALWQASEHFEDGQFSQTFGILNNCPTQFGLTASQITENNQTIALYQYLQGKNIHALDASAQATLRSLIPTYTGYAKMIATNLLVPYDLSQIPITVITPRSSSYLQSLVTVFPNPSSEFTTLQWLSEDEVEVAIKVLDNFGKLVVEKVITGNSWNWQHPNIQSGTYYYQIEGKTSKRQLAAGKILIQR